MARARGLWVGTIAVNVVAIAAVAATLTPTASATFPGGNGRILFERFSPRYGVFTMAPDGNDVRRLEPRLAFS